MTIREIAQILGAQVLCGQDDLDRSVDHAFASDLMSDVLTLRNDHVMLITGLANMQTIRTAEMADIVCVIFARNKQVSPEMIALAEENGLIVLASKYSVFKVSGLLYQAGIQPIF